MEFFLFCNHPKGRGADVEKVQIPAGFALLLAALTIPPSAWNRLPILEIIGAKRTFNLSAISLPRFFCFKRGGGQQLSSHDQGVF